MLTFSCCSQWLQFAVKLHKVKLLKDLSVIDCICNYALQRTFGQKLAENAKCSHLHNEYLGLKLAANEIFNICIGLLLVTETAA